MNKYHAVAVAVITALLIIVGAVFAPSHFGLLGETVKPIHNYIAYLNNNEICVDGSLTHDGVAKACEAARNYEGCSKVSASECVDTDVPLIFGGVYE